MGCKCIKQANKALEEAGENTVIDVPISINFQTGKMGQPRCCIVVRKLDSKKRKQLKTIMATYCPICGKRYKE